MRQNHSISWLGFSFSILLGITILVGTHYLRPRAISSIEWTGNQTLSTQVLEKEFWQAAVGERGEKEAAAGEVGEKEAAAGLQINLLEIGYAMNALRNNTRIRRVNFSLAENETLQVVLQEKKCIAIVRDSFSRKEFGIDSLLSILHVLPADYRKAKPDCGKNPILLVGSFRRTAHSFDDPTLQDMLNFLQRLQAYDPTILSRISLFRQNADQNMTLIFTRIGLRIELAEDLRKADAAKVVASQQYYEKQGFRSGLIDMRGSDTVLFPG